MVSMCTVKGKCAVEQFNNEMCIVDKEGKSVIAILNYMKCM